MTAAAQAAADRPYKPRAAPAYPAIGRQPEVRHHIPSKPNPWYGSVVEGDDLTVQQRMALADLGDRAPAEIMTVRRYATDREMYWGTDNSVRPYFEFTCPVVRRRADGRIYVISPIGDVKLIRDDGWTF